MDGKQVGPIQDIQTCFVPVVRFVNTTSSISDPFMFTARGFVSSGLFSVSEEDGLSLLGF